MTKDEKDIWTQRMQALGNMGIATVLVVALSISTYIEGESRNETMASVARSAETHNEYTKERNIMIARFVENQDKHFASLERLIRTIEEK